MSNKEISPSEYVRSIGFASLAQLARLEGCTANYLRRLAKNDRHKFDDIVYHAKPFRNQWRKK